MIYSWGRETYDDSDILQGCKYSIFKPQIRGNGGGGHLGKEIMKNSSNIKRNSISSENYLHPWYFVKAGFIGYGWSISK